MGDYLGGKYIGEYIGKLISRGNTEKEKVIGDEVLALFTIRSKYLHGKPKGEDSVEKTFRSKFQGRIELLEEAVDRLEHYLKQTLLVSILNAGFKEKISAYHESHGRLTVSFIKKPADLNPIDFPEFKTIYY
jgi:hypothetical protein